MTVGLHNYKVLYTYSAWAVIKRTDVDINIDIKKKKLLQRVLLRNK